MRFSEDNVAAAAFYDLEGTLVSTNLVHTLGFYAKNQQGLFRTFTKSASTLLSLPSFAATDQYSRKVFNDLFFKRYKGESEDRLRFFAEELFADVLKPAVFPGAFELIEKSRKLGLRQVVVTGALDMSVDPLMKHLGIEDYAANRLEFVNGVATGRLLPPVLAAATKTEVAHDYHGTKVPDPYRWLEDLASPETKACVEAENKLTFDYLNQIPERAAIKARLTKLWNYERYGVPFKEGGRYFYTKN